MKMKKCLAIVLCMLCINALADNPKREMRATWLTSVANIDWPQQTGANFQQKEMIKMLDSLQTLRMNTVMFQVRPCCDALYNSAYEPWSSYLKINRGETPTYDPLQFVIDECHKRGLSCHAWLNPYRYNKRGSSSDWSGKDDCELNYSHTHPEWLLWYKSDIILDPAQPEVRQRIKDVVGDILSKYAVDGIIFDDYFYPYGGTTNQDSASVRKYKPAGMSTDDWRRQNVNRMIADVYDTIQAVKPWVTFGVSPFGIWTTSYTVARAEGVSIPGSISGGNMYQEIYCDPVAWLKEGTVDYVSPQLYWKIGGSQDYKTLSKWWGDVCNRFGAHFYSSMAVYRYSDHASNSSNSAFTIDEMENEAKLNRTAVTDNAPGAVFYNTRAFVYDKTFRNAFKANEFIYPALQPAINWKPAPEQPMVENLKAEGQTLTWTHVNNGQVHYAIYAVPVKFRNRVSIFSIGDALVGISYEPTFTLPDKYSTSAYKIGVSVLDGYNNEYSLRILGEEVGTPEPTTLLSPNDGDARKWPVNFSWKLMGGADSYVFQFTRDKECKQIVVTQEVTSNEFNSALRLNLNELELGEYYWRVKVRKPNCNDVWTEPRRIVISTADDIENVEVGTRKNGIYSILGQYLGTDEATLAPGMYIINGKKQIIR